MKRRKYLLIASMIILFIVQLVIPMLYYVKGDSMNPTFHDKELVMIDYYSFSNIYERNDIIVFNINGEKLIKRIIGVGGDHVQIIDNILYINEIKVEEDYILEPMNTKDIDFMVPANSIFVLGDNRNHSDDSRVIGLITQQNIVGKVIYTFE